MQKQIKAQEGKTSLEEIHNQYEQYIKLFQTNGNIFANVATELIKQTKVKMRKKKEYKNKV